MCQDQHDDPEQAGSMNHTSRILSVPEEPMAGPQEPRRLIIADAR